MNETAVSPKSKSELAGQYRVSVDTFMSWLLPFEKDMKKLGYRRKQKILTIAQVRLVYEKLGTP